MRHVHVRRVVSAALLLGTLVACGGGSPSPGPGPETVFTEGNAWTGELPTGAEMLSPDEFRRRVDAGEYRVFSDATLEAQAAAGAAQFSKDRAVLESTPNLSPTLQMLRDEIAASPTPEGDRPAALPGGGSVLVLGRSAQLRGAAEALRLAGSVDNALAAYDLSYALLPVALRSGVPAPAELRGRPLAEVQAALWGLEALLDAQPQTLGAARREAPAGRLATQALAFNPGGGRDEDSNCNAPTGLYSRYWFPLKHFLSPVKDQGRRGTCWAFTALGALESREMVQRGSAPNLSEQFLVNKVKRDWAPSDYEDGYTADEALLWARLLGQSMPNEPDWTYNRSSGRPLKGSGAALYTNSCTGYAGTCSDTAHQSPAVCTSVGALRVCAYLNVSHRGGGVASGPTAQVWSSGQTFPLARLRGLLAGGHALMAFFPVYRGFQDDVGADGVVHNYVATHLNDQNVEVPGPSGNHMALIVGFLSNADLKTGANTPTIGGGGYFILKNSWGCKAGDGGYYYVPADYVQRHFISLSALAFGSQRSAAWTQEQALPGRSDTPVMEVQATPLLAELRAPVNLAAAFRVSHTVAKSVELTVTSDRDGTLYSGPWSTDRSAVIAPPELRRSFGTVGLRTLTVRAAFGQRQAQVTLAVNVVNTPPSVRFPQTDVAYQGEVFQLRAQISDPSEFDTAALCARTTWAVTAPDVLVAAAGCQAHVRFGATGPRFVRATARDTEGQTVSANAQLDVQPPPANPYPRVSADVASRESTGPLNLCGEVTVDPNATIDLRKDGCRALVTQPLPPRYVARAVVDNPSGEALSYDWKLVIGKENTAITLLEKNDSPDPTFELSDRRPGEESDEITRACHVELEVNAPDPARSKKLTVWSGNCINYLPAPR
ncbi:C1 family peptidase [Deinococcus yunweiensis]|uniref:C1 family peptidase n=1 Tax=Deinococcus yunweiensis TaxID=367282 RepID=UPI00398F63A3